MNFLFQTYILRPESMFPHMRAQYDDALSGTFHVVDRETDEDVVTDATGTAAVVACMKHNRKEDLLVTRSLEGAIWGQINGEEFAADPTSILLVERD